MTLKPNAAVATAPSAAKGAEGGGIVLNYHLTCSVTSTALIQFRSINSRVDGSPLGLEGIVVDAFAFHLVRDEVAARSPSSMGALAVPAMVEVTIRWLSLNLLPVTSSAVTALIVGAITVAMT
jgi:hypothetical protein